MDATEIIKLSRRVNFDKTQTQNWGTNLIFNPLQTRKGSIKFYKNTTTNITKFLREHPDYGIEQTAQGLEFVERRVINANIVNQLQSLERQTIINDVRRKIDDSELVVENRGNPIIYRRLYTRYLFRVDGIDEDFFNDMEYFFESGDIDSGNYIASDINRPNPYLRVLYVKLVDAYNWVRERQPNIGAFNIALGFQYFERDGEPDEGRWVDFWRTIHPNSLTSFKTFTDMLYRLFEVSGDDHYDNDNVDPTYQRLKFTSFDISYFNVGAGNQAQNNARHKYMLFETESMIKSKESCISGSMRRCGYVSDELKDMTSMKKLIEYIELNKLPINIIYN